MLPSADSLKQTGGRSLAGIVFDEQAIAARVRALGREITAQYPDGDLLVVGLLKGSFIFLSDLVRRIERPLQVDFLVAASYGAETTSRGTVHLLYDPETELAGKHILLVEDIVETGSTLNRLVTLLRERRPRSLNVCALLRQAHGRTDGAGTGVRRVRRPPELSGGVRSRPRRELPAPSLYCESDVMANRIQPPRDFNWGRTLRTLSFWALLIAGSIALVQFASSRRQDAVDMSYSQFTEQLESGQRRDGGDHRAAAAARRLQDAGHDRAPHGRAFHHAAAVRVERRAGSPPCGKRAWTSARERKSSRSASSCSASCRTCSSSA